MTTPIFNKKVSFAQLPNEINLSILKRVPLQTRLQLRAVCIRWCVQIEELCLKRESLKLFANRGCIGSFGRRLANMSAHDVKYWALKNLPRDDDLLLESSQISKPCCDVLAHLFPNVKHLVCVYPNSLSVDLAYLFRKYGSTCISLSLFALAYNEKNKHNYKILTLKVLPAINSMRALKRLDLFAECQQIFYAYYSRDIQVTSHLSRVMPQLESLSLPGSLWPLSDLAVPRTEHNLTHLRLDLDNSYLRPTPWLRLVFVFYPNVCANLTHLRLEGLNMNFYNLLNWSNFALLQYLYLSFQKDNKPLTELLSDLSKLSNLTELRLANLANYDHRNLTQPIMTIGQRTQLKTVTVLTLPDFFQNAHLIFNGELFCKTIAAWFPALERLNVLTVYSLVRTQIELHKNRFRHLKQFQLSPEDADGRKYLGRHATRSM